MIGDISLHLLTHRRESVVANLHVGASDLEADLESKAAMSHGQAKGLSFTLDGGWEYGEGRPRAYLVVA